MKKTIPFFVLLLFMAIRCGKTPLPLPPDQTGAIRITVEGAAPGDSIRVILDDQVAGTYSGFTLLNQVIVGFHKLSVFIGNAATPPQFVEVRRGETTPVTFKFFAGPYVGNKALLFSVKDVKGDSISLSKQKGKVVLLIFFEHT